MKKPKPKPKPKPKLKPKAKPKPKKPKPNEFALAVGRGLRRSAKVARKVARMYGTPIYISVDGKVKAIKP